MDGYWEDFEAFYYKAGCIDLNEVRHEAGMPEIKIERNNPTDFTRLTTEEYAITVNNYEGIEYNS